HGDDLRVRPASGSAAAAERRGVAGSRALAPPRVRIRVPEPESPRIQLARARSLRARRSHGRGQAMDSAARQRAGARSDYRAGGGAQGGDLSAHMAQGRRESSRRIDADGCGRAGAASSFRADHLRTHGGRLGGGTSRRAPAREYFDRPRWVGSDCRIRRNGGPRSWRRADHLWQRRGRAQLCLATRQGDGSGHSGAGSTDDPGREFEAHDDADPEGKRDSRLKTEFVEIAGARIYCRDTGAGSPLLFLHGGWGYEVYPFDRQIEALGGKYRILIPDRTGYGRSPRITS